MQILSGPLKLNFQKSSQVILHRTTLLDLLPVAWEVTEGFKSIM